MGWRDGGGGGCVCNYVRVSLCMCWREKKKGKKPRCAVVLHLDFSVPLTVFSSSPELIRIDRICM